MSGMEKQTPVRPLRPLVSDLNPALMCRLCGGYYVDAAAIIECLHAFCKSCLVRYLETNKYCPICDVQVHKSRPLQNIRLDPTLQDMVYKLVPGLYHKEMKSRREFYSSRPDAPPSSLEDRGETPPELCPFYTPDETVSLVLEYKHPEPESDPNSNIKDSQSKRFLRCPAAVKITHLQKLLRNKYGLDNRYNIDLMLEDSKLPPDLTLMDVAYAFGRKRKGQFLFTYRIYDLQCKKMRFSDSDMDTLPPPEIKAEVQIELGNFPVASLSSAETSAPTTSTATCVVTSLPARMTTTSSVTAPVTSAAVSVTAAVPPATPATSSVTASAPADPVTIATSSMLTITPVSLAATSAPITKSIPVSANTYITTTAPSLKVSVQRLNPANVKSVASGPAKVEKSTAPPTPTDKSNKLDSIISRLGDPSKHPRPEAALKKDLKKPQGKEVQLRISENGEMITNVVQNEKSPPPQPRPATPQPKPASPQPKPASPQLKPAPLQLKPATPQPKPAAPQPKPPTPQPKPVMPQPKPVTPQPKTVTPQPKTVTPQPKPVTPQPKPGTPHPKLGAPVAKSTPPKVSNSTKPEISTSSELTPRPGAVTPVSPSGVVSPRKPGSSPVGYKTLKSGPKSWNPTISRNSFLSAKLEQQQQVQKAQQQIRDSLPDAAKSPLPDPPKPPRFFKARNTPRYLGNPASGVKPMYQVASPPPSVQKPPSKPSPRPAAVLKLNPKTLTPIMTSPSASGAASSPPPTKDRPPFLSTTISGSNHLPSSRGVTTTSTTVTENLSKMSSADLAMRSAPSPHPYMRLFSYCDPLNPFHPRLGDPNRIPSSPPYSLLRAPFSPLLANSYGHSRPPVGMLYNQSLQRQMNHTGPLSPVPGLPSPLPPSSAPLSPSSTLKNIIPPAPWVQASPPSKVPLSPQPVPSKKPSTDGQPKALDRQTKVNGEKSQAKDKSVVAPVKPVEAEKKEGETRATSVKDNTREPKSSEQDNNNTVVINKKLESVVEQPQALSHNISKLCSPDPSGKEPPAAKVEKTTKVENLQPSADQVAIKQT